MSGALENSVGDIFVVEQRLKRMKRKLERSIDEVLDKRAPNIPFANVERKGITSRVALRKTPRDGERDR